MPWIRQHEKRLEKSGERKKKKNNLGKLQKW